MRSLFNVCIAVALATALCGCGLFRKKKTARPVAPPAAAVTQNSLIVASTIVGKVESVKLESKFAVIAFPVGQVPPIDTRMVVYRGDAIVGEVKITGPRLFDDLAPADIVRGTVEKNDEVRSN